MTRPRSVARIAYGGYGLATDMLVASVVAETMRGMSQRKGELMSEIRRCRSTWVMCDGNCSGCEFYATSSTNYLPVGAAWLWQIDVRCSRCNYKLETTGLPMICPHCGARMDGKENR